MHRRTSTCGICVLALLLVAAAIDVRAQDAQPKTAENAPPDYGALPPAGRYYDADLAKRVADLEKQLADYAKAADAAKSQAPTKPLIAPSGRIQWMWRTSLKTPPATSSSATPKTAWAFAAQTCGLGGI